MPVRALIVSGKDSVDLRVDLLNVFLGDYEQVKLFSRDGTGELAGFASVDDDDGPEFVIGYLHGLVAAQDDALALLKSFLAEFDIVFYLVDVRKPFPSADVQLFKKLYEVIKTTTALFVVAGHGVSGRSLAPYRNSLANAITKIIKDNVIVKLFQTVPAGLADVDDAAQLLQSRQRCLIEVTIQRPQSTMIYWAEIAAALMHWWPMGTPMPKFIKDFVKVLSKEMDVLESFGALMKLPKSVADSTVISGNGMQVMMLKCFHLNDLTPLQFLKLFLWKPLHDHPLFSKAMAEHLSAEEREKASEYPTTALYLAAQSIYAPIVRVSYMSATELVAAEPQIRGLFLEMKWPEFPLLSAVVDLNNFEVRKRWWPNSEGTYYADCQGPFMLAKILKFVK